MHLAAATLAFAGLIASMGGAAACSCAHPSPGQPDYDLYKVDWKTWKLSREALVLRGRIIQAQAPAPKAIIHSYTAKMQVASVLKGNVAPGAYLTLVTGMGGGDCGFGESFIDWEHQKREVTLGLSRLGSGNGADYAVGLCGYNE
jgi:hypothetical protein